MAGTSSYPGAADPVTAYVVNYDLGVVTPISTATGKPGKAIRVGANPFAIAITPDGKTAYVNGLPGVTPVSTATGRPGKIIKVAGEAYALAITQTARPPTSPTSYRTR